MEGGCVMNVIAIVPCGEFIFNKRWNLMYGECVMKLQFKAALLKLIDSEKWQ